MAKHITISSKGFPGTNKTWRFMQEAFREPLEALARNAGHKTIVSGLMLSGDVYTDGFICYNGEILPFTGGAPSESVTIVEEVEQVTYNVDVNNDGQLDILPAYVTRYARFGTGGETVFPFTDLTRLKTLQELSAFALPAGMVIDAQYVHTDNNFTDALVQLLESIVSNVQADWNATAGLSKILNKPSNIVTALKDNNIYIGDVSGVVDIPISFNTPVTVAYKVWVSFEANSPGDSAGTATLLYSIKERNSNGFVITLRENGNNTQGLRLFWTVVPQYIS